jgi:three-Cys-motif partner protein
VKRSPRKKDDFQWWVDRITPLRGLKDEARMLFESAGVAYEVGPWAVLKLAALEYYVSLYTTIVKSIFDRAYYLDLFSGPGLNRIRDGGTVIFGSPLIADRAPAPEKKFDKLFLIEKDNHYSRALGALLPEATVVNSDVNMSGLQEACGKIPTSDPCLAFVDPEGFELHWKTLCTLLERWSDIIINFQTSSVGRVAGSVSRNPSNAETLDDFFGTGNWRECNGDIDYLELYEEQLRKYKDYTFHIRIQGPKSFYYHLVFAVKKTKGTQRWINAILRVKERIERADYALAEKLLNVLEGKQTTLERKQVTLF